MKYGLRSCVGSRIRMMSRIADNHYRKHLKGTGVTEFQLNLLLVLYTTGEIEQSEIGKMLCLDRSSVSRNLDKLIKQGWVLKRGTPTRPLVVLSPEGEKKVQELLPKWEKAMDELHELLGEEGMALIGQLEKRIR